MLKETNRDIILISLYPRYIDAIASGVKKVEFRKASFPSHIRKIYIYGTKPISAIVGFVNVINVFKASPYTIWKKYNGSGGISPIEFNNYYSDNKAATAIEISTLTKLDVAVPLNTLINTKNPPQHFTYLTDNDIKRIHR